jgi:hypothetical protein
LLGIHVVYNQADLGVINADPSYDLVLHHNDPVCSPGWCAHVENFDGGAGNLSGGVAAFFINILGLAAVVEYEVDDSLTDQFKNTTGLPDPFTFCFPDPNTATPHAAITISDQNHPVTWGTGSITACTAYIPQD